jgi:hypothetical protein
VDGITTNKEKIVEVAMPLLRVRDEDGAETIVNASAAAFVGAKAAEECSRGPTRGNELPVP